MNQILLSFLCGAAFIGGGVAVTVMVAMAVSLKTNKSNEKLYNYWQDSIEKHGEQIEILERIAAQLEKK